MGNSSSPNPLNSGVVELYCEPSAAKPDEAAKPDVAEGVDVEGEDRCRKMGVPYEQVLRWARDDYRWADVLEICRERCLDNVEIAAMMKRMKFREALKYMGDPKLFY